MENKKIELISKALGDETRLRIYEVIAANKNLTCGELVTLHGVTPATISHHLKILADAGLIKCRTERPSGAGANGEEWPCDGQGREEMI
jgi:ArsR family transcriptional regulator